jgi:TrmH family RNA methyltransferase
LLSKNKIKFIRSLEQKKNRRQENAFIAEGHKTVGDLLLAGFQPLLIVHTEEWKSPIPLPCGAEVIAVSDEELRKASLLLHPQQVIAILKIPDTSNSLTPSTASDDLVLCLDGVQDPGNLGTIIRTADWFGIKHIICSQQTVDAFSPKVVQATMGSIARVSVHYTDLTSFLTSLPKGTPVYGTFLDGKNLYHEQLKPNGVIIMGNEGNGISPEIARHVTHRLLIPPYPADSDTVESLNVSIATAIICAEFRRINFVNNS